MAIALSDRFGITVGVDDLDESTSVEDMYRKVDLVPLIKLTNNMLALTPP